SLGWRKYATPYRRSLLRHNQAISPSRFRSSAGQIRDDLSRARCAFPETPLNNWPLRSDRLFTLLRSLGIILDDNPIGAQGPSSWARLNSCLALECNLDVPSYCLR